MSDEPTKLDQLKYRFDNYISRGGSSLFVIFVVLFVLFVAVMFLLRLVLSLFLPAGTHGADSGPTESAIVAFLQTFDPGYMAGDLSSSHWLLGAAVIAGVGGIVLIAILIAFTDIAFDDRLTRLRRGHSQVVEQGHTLILGWDEERVVEIIREFARANEKSANANSMCTKANGKAAKLNKGKRRKVVVVLADQDKGYMDDHLKLRLRDVKSTRFVTRSGSPSSVTNLEVVSASTAKSAIILSEYPYTACDSMKEEADAGVLKTLLALESHVPDGDPLNVVVDLFRSKARDASGMVDAASVEAIDSKNVLARILLQTSRSVGLSVVYNELFSFEGAEIYVVDGDWKGMCFRDVSDRFTHGIPIGIQTGDGSITINPGLGTELNPKDRIVLVAEDDSDICFEPDLVTKAWERAEPVDRGPRAVERQLLIGWGPKTTRLLSEYAKYVDAASTVHIMKRSPDNDDPRQCDIEEFEGRLEAKVLRNDPTDPRTWDAGAAWDPNPDPDWGPDPDCGVDTRPEPVNPLEYDHIIILSDGDRDVSSDVVDARTITILLLLRDAIRSSEKDRSEQRTTIVTELVESDNQVIAPNVGLHDFVVSSRIVSMLFAQVSENPVMHEIYRSIFNEEGAEIYVKPIGRYVPELPAEVSFSELMDLANQHHEICIGVKIKNFEDDNDRNHGVDLIPDREELIKLVDGDSLVVLSEHDS